VETAGSVLKAIVHPANVPDREGAPPVLTAARLDQPRLERVWVDAGSTGALLGWAQEALGLTQEVTKRPRRWLRTPATQEPPPLPARFPVLARRWVIERTFAWLGRHRRLSKDYEALPATEEAWIYLAMNRLMLARLAR
jgi:putative transposase